MIIIKSIKIGVDLDDTLWDLLPVWLSKFRERTDCNVYPEDIKSWDIEKYIPSNLKDILFNTMLDCPDIWDEVQPKEKAQQVLKLFIENPNIELFIVTATDYRVAPNKFKRLFELFPYLNKDNLIITKRKDLINVDIMIDDNPHNLNGDYIKVLFDAPHNRNIDTNTKYLRVYDWTDVENIINKFITLLCKKEGVCL